MNRVSALAKAASIIISISITMGLRLPYVRFSTLFVDYCEGATIAHVAAMLLEPATIGVAMLLCENGNLCCVIS